MENKFNEFEDTSSDEITIKKKESNSEDESMDSREEDGHNKKQLSEDIEKLVTKLKAVNPKYPRFKFVQFNKLVLELEDKLKQYETFYTKLPNHDAIQNLIEAKKSNVSKNRKEQVELNDDKKSNKEGNTKKYK